MARRSREDMEAEKFARLQSKKVQKVYSAAIYVRLSLENSGKPNEKNVLANQIDQCQAFLKENPELNFSGIYEDNGKTGTNFDREGFQNLLRDIDSDKINCIIVRDFSRFGRNRLECVRFISKVFPDLGVRFISINDHYDSEKDDDSALKVLVQNLVNELYSKDISRKVSTALKSQMSDGTFHHRNLPYGYMWSENRESIIVDEEVSDYVKMIFRWKLEGVSAYAMCKKLDELNAPLPEARKLENGVRSGSGVLATQWAKSTLYGILVNPHYVGDSVFGKSERALYKGIKYKKIKDEESLFTFPNTHPALISREDFKAIQEILEKDSLARQTKMAESDNKRATMVDLFSGKTFCADCGRKMYFKRHKDIYHGKKEDKVKWSGIYNCSTNVRRLTPTCTPHHLQQKVLEERVLSAIKMQVKVAIDYEKLLVKLRHSAADTSVRDKQNALISSLKLKINGVKKRLSVLYDDYIDEILTQEEYLFAKQTYSDDLSSMELRLNEAIEQKQEFCEAMSTDNKWITLMKSVSKKKKLSQTLVDTTIEKVLCYEDGSIELVMKYNDIFALMKSSITIVEKEVL